jgi:MFS transporter, DHA1 family, tetracycline resistance protein
MTAPATATAPKPPTRAAFIFIFITVALDMLALGIIIPVLPKLVVELNGGDTASGARMLGWLGTVWATMQFVFAPVIGALSDHFGRRRVILISTLGLGLDYFVMALAPDLKWLFVGRVISGITSASYATAFAYIADTTAAEKRAGTFGKLGAAFGIGFLIGPAVGGILGRISLRLPFWVAGALGLLGTAYGYFILPESLPPERRAPFRWRRANPVGSWHLLRTDRVLLGLAIAAFLYRLGHDAAPNIFVLYTGHRYGWDTGTVGLALLAVGIGSAIVQAGLVGRIVKWMGERRAMLTGFSAGATADIVFGLAATGSAFMAGVPFSALFGLAYPSLQGLMSRRVGAAEQGRLQGAMASITGLSGIIAPLLFTQTFALAIAPGRDPMLVGAPFFVAALLLIAAMGIGGLAARATAAPLPSSEAT